MSRWVEFEMEEKIREVLSEVRNDRGEDHHFGRPLYTGMQIAIHICRRYPNFLEETGMELGGEGTRDKETLARYISRELSRKINEGKITDIEGFLLANDRIREMDFVDHKGNEIESNMGSDIALFRLKDE